MIGSYEGLIWRQVRTRRLRAVLTAFGIVLGVGMVFGVLTLTGTIRATFDNMIDSAWGSKDLIVTPVSGGGVLPQDEVANVQATPGVKSASGMIGSIFVRFNDRGKAIKGNAGRMYVAGYDTSRPPPYDFQWVSGHAPTIGTGIGVERNWARDHGIALGEVVRVGTAQGPRSLPVVGIFKFSNNLSFGGAGIAAMPVHAARQLMSIPRGWHQVSLTATDRSEVKALQQRLEGALGPGVKVRSPQGVGEDLSKSLRALDVVLYFFAGIALFVGGFLILNSFSMTVLQRTRELGMLRTLGATRRMITRSILIEALALGLLGSVLGLALGLGLAVGLVALMRGLNIPVGNVQVAGGSALVAVLTGMIATFIGAWWPARRAGRIPPIRAVLGVRQATGRGRIAVRAVAGVLLFLPGVILGGSLWMGGEESDAALRGMAATVLTMAMFVGMVLAAPVIIPPLVELIGRPMRRLAPTGGRMATDAARSNRARTAATAMALTIGLSVVVVNAGMASSFLGTIRDQVDAGWTRDVTVQPQGATLEDGGGQTIDPSVRAQIAALPQAGTVTPLRLTLIELPKLKGSTGLAEGIDPGAWGVVDHTAVKDASREDALAGVAAGGAMISRSYATSAGLHVGDSVDLRGADRTRRVRITGILNAMSPLPVIQISQETMREVYGVTADAQILVTARNPSQRAALATAIQQLLDRSHPELESLSNAEIKQNFTDAVNRQFGLFNAIVFIAIIVSLLGVVNTLAMSVAERTREIGVLRALGASRWLVRLSMLDESALITGSGTLAGVGLGTLIAWSWVSSLDSAMPGITFRFPVAQAVGFSVAAIALGILAAALPARRAARLNILEAVSYE